MLNSRLQVAAWFLFGAVAFALAHGQAPLYYSNQNQYYLHGLADAGLGHLDEDWLANTVDPTPVFSCLVRVTVTMFPPFVFHVYYGLLLGIYLTSLVAVFRYLAKERDSFALRLGFVVLIVLIHSSALRWLSYRFLKLDYPWYFQAGVAGQYTLGAMLQPSTFGVFLLASLVLFLYQRPILAVLCIGLAVTVHSTYLLAGGLFTFAYLCVLWAEGKRSLAFGIGILALALVMPTMIYVWIAFQPTSPEMFAESQRILAQVRLPHHCLPKLWFDPIAMAQVAWIVLGAILVWGTRLFWLIVIPLVLAFALTVLQVATNSNTLALMFPWRISAFLVPISTAVVVARFVLLTVHWWNTRVMQGVCAVGITILVASGVTIMVLCEGYRSNEEEVEMMDYVRDRKKQGEVYLMPVALQPLNVTTVGSKSTDFQPLAAKQSDSRIIKVDLQRFRLYTGAAIYVDFKAMPYKDVDVLEWLARMKRTQQLYVDMREGKNVQKSLKALGITHVIAKVEDDFSLLRMKEVHKDQLYRVYSVEADD